MTFTDLSVWQNLLLFCVGAGVIWWAGTRSEHLTDTIARRTGIGSAFAGLVLLAGVTSLPELATTVTAMLRGNTELAIHNLFGGVAFQVVVLAIADAASRRGPLTGFASSFGLLVQGVGLVFLLGVAMGSLVLAGAAQFPVTVGPVTLGLNPVVLLLPLAYFGVAWVTRQAEAHPQWRPVHDPPEKDAPDEDETPGGSGASLALAFTGFALLVLAGGWLAASAADVVAQQSGLSSGFIGATLLAAASSLPEVSTTVAAVRDENEELAVANVFGSNSFDLALLALVSLMAADSFAGGALGSVVFIAALGTVLTAVYLWGLLAHSTRAVGRIGLDSTAVVVLYVAAMAALYGLA